MVAETTPETKLAVEYETLRRQQYELITDLLDVLPRIDNLSEEGLVQARDALFHADHPYLMVFVGPFSSGKSSIINALLGQPELLAVGPTPTTDSISILRYGEESEQMGTGEVKTVFSSSPLLKKVSFVDTPGLESVFQRHEDRTRSFLHRSDTVLLVMLATQAMTAGNVKYLQLLKDYGKNIIVLINQADLLSAEEAETVRNYVLDQCRAELGFKPPVWMVSARKGLQARQSDPIDETLWSESGLANVEEYIDEQLSDVARLRQKLQTPMQIIQRVSQTALTAVRENQAALDLYQNIAENIDEQLNVQQREHERYLRGAKDEVGEKFDESSRRAGEAIRELFRLSQALSLFTRGVTELIGISGLLRRAGAESYVQKAFEKQRVFEPISELPELVDKIGPRIEGKDVQDIDQLVDYARNEIDALPPAIKGKVIGTVQAPVRYEREALQQMRPQLEDIEDQARQLETDKLERTLRNTLLYLAAYEILLVVFGIFLVGTFAGEPQVALIVFVMLIALALLGFLVMPLRGRMIDTSYAQQMQSLRDQYLEVLNKATDKQLSYGMTCRRDAVLPLTRLVEAQTKLQTEQMSKLQTAQQTMVQVEADLASLGKKKNLLGI